MFTVFVLCLAWEIQCRLLAAQKRRATRGILLYILSNRCPLHTMRRRGCLPGWQGVWLVDDWFSGARTMKRARRWLCIGGECGARMGGANSETVKGGERGTRKTMEGGGPLFVLHHGQHEPWLP